MERNPSEKNDRLSASRSGTYEALKISAKSLSEDEKAPRSSSPTDTPISDKTKSSTLFSPCESTHAGLIHTFSCIKRISNEASTPWAISSCLPFPFFPFSFIPFMKGAFEQQNRDAMQLGGIASWANYHRASSILTVPLEPLESLIGWDVARQSIPLVRLLHRCGTSRDWFQNSFIGLACFGFVWDYIFFIASWWRQNEGALKKGIKEKGKIGKGRQLLMAYDLLSRS